MIFSKYKFCNYQVLKMNYIEGGTQFFYFILCLGFHLEANRYDHSGVSGSFWTTHGVKTLVCDCLGKLCRYKLRSVNQGVTKLWLTQRICVICHRDPQGHMSVSTLLSEWRQQFSGNYENETESCWLIFYLMTSEFLCLLVIALAGFLWDWFRFCSLVLRSCMVSVAWCSIQIQIIYSTRSRRYFREKYTFNWWYHLY